LQSSIACRLRLRSPELRIIWHHILFTTTLESSSQDSIQTKQCSLQQNPAPKLPVEIIKGQVLWLTAKAPRELGWRTSAHSQPRDRRSRMSSAGEHHDWLTPNNATETQKPSQPPKPSKTTRPAGRCPTRDLSCLRLILPDARWPGIRCLLR